MKFQTLLLAATAVLFAAPINDVDPVKLLGSANAPVRLEVFSDFACPMCKQFHEQLLPILMKDYVSTGKVSILMREYPLPIPEHKYSREAAAWATAAGKVGKYNQVADKLFETQSTWNANGKIADVVLPVVGPMEQKKVEGLSRDPAIAAEVQKDVDIGLAARVNQTPTMLIKRGSTVYPFPGPSVQNYQLIKSLIDGLLR